MSATQQVSIFVKTMVSQENRSLKEPEIWKKLLEQPNLKKMLFNTGKPRKGILVGLLYRVRQNKVKGLQAVLVDGQWQYQEKSDTLLDVVEYVEILSRKFKSLDLNTKIMNGNQLMLYEKTAHDIAHLKNDISEIKLAYKRNK